MLSRPLANFRGIFGELQPVGGAAEFALCIRGRNSVSSSFHSRCRDKIVLVMFNDKGFVSMSGQILVTTLVLDDITFGQVVSALPVAFPGHPPF